MPSTTTCVVILAVACSSPTRATSIELGDTHASPAIEPRDRPDRAHLRYDMRQRLSDLDRVVDALLANRLDEARVMSFSIARVSSGETRRAALALSNAASVDTAGRLAAHLTATCATCHRGRAPSPELAIPADDGSSRTRMARHLWAVRRARDGLMSETVAPWRSGLEVLAADPIVTPDPAAGRALQQRARSGLVHVATDTLDDRVRVYGDVLVACARCHQRR